MAAYVAENWEMVLRGFGGRGVKGVGLASMRSVTARSGGLYPNIHHNNITLTQAWAHEYHNWAEWSEWLGRQAELV